MKTLYLFSFLVLISFSLSAQQEFPKITNLDRIQLQNEAQETVNNFCRALSRLASKDLDREQKESLKSQLESFFIENATMDVGTIKNGKYIHNEAPMDDYLNGVARYKKKYNVVLLTFEAVKIDVGKLRDTVYNGQPAKLGKFSFIQKLEVQKSSISPAVMMENQGVANVGRPAKIVDISSKEGSIVILRRKSKPFENGKKYTILLGSVTVDEVQVTK